MSRFALALVLLAGCSSDPPPAAVTVPAPSAAPAASTPPVASEAPALPAPSASVALTDSDAGLGPPLGNIGQLGGGTKGSSPSLRQGAVSVTGKLPTEVVQRIIRQNFGRFRLCYEAGLKKDVNLAGRVSVKFGIDKTGSVTNAADGGSDLKDKDVIACVVRAFTGLSFPQPESGTVSVVYPILFAPPPPPVP